MARRNHSLVVTLLVMIAALIGAILWGGAPPNGAGNGPGDSRSEEPDQVPIVAVAPGQIALRGQLMSGSEPAAGVEIVFARVSSFPFEFFGDPSVAKVTTRTDAAGRFALVIERDRSGRLSLPREGGFLFRSIDGQYADALPADAQLADHDLGAIAVVRTASLSGRVLDTEGKTLEGAIVRCSPKGSGADPDREAQIRSDENGAFELQGLYPGVARIRVEADGFRPFERDVELRPGSEVEGLELELVRGLSITGRIVDDSGWPLPGVRVVARSEEGEELASTESGPFANYELGGLAEGVVAVEAVSPRHAPFRLEGLKPGTAGLRLRMRRLGRISGELVGRDGRAIAGSTVVARPIDGPVGGASEDLREAVTDEQGVFVLENVTPGTLTLSARGSGHLPARSNAPVTLQPGQTIEHLRIQAVRTAVLRADVVDLDGAKVPDAEVRVEVTGRVIGVSPVGGSEVQVPGSLTRTVAVGRTDAEGRVVFDQLPPDQLSVVADHRKYAPSAVVGIRLDPADTKDILLTVLRAGSVAITATSESQKLGGLTFRVRATSNDLIGRRVVTDGDGRVVVEGLAPGRYRVELLQPVQGDENPVVRADVPAIELDVEAGSVAEAPFELPLRSTLAGRVSDSAGPLEGVSIELRPAGGGEGQITSPDEGGRFSLEGLAPGTWNLTVRIADRPVPLHRTLEIPGGGSTVRLGLALETGTLSGEVVDDAGARRAGISLEIRATEPRWAETVRVPLLTGEDGRFRIQGVPVGVYELVFSGPGLVPQRLPGVSLLPEQSLELDPLTLPRTGKILAEVSLEALAGAGGQWFLQWRKAGSDPAWNDSAQRADLDAEGRAVLDGLAPGSYELRLVETVETGERRTGVVRTVSLDAGVEAVAPLELPGNQR